MKLKLKETSSEFSVKTYREHPEDKHLILDFVEYFSNEEDAINYANNSLTKSAKAEVFSPEGDLIKEFKKEGFQEADTNFSIKIIVNGELSYSNELPFKDIQEILSVANSISPTTVYENEESTDLDNLVGKVTSGGKFPPTISYKGNTYREYQVLDFDNPEVSNVYYCNMDNVSTGDPEDSDDYFIVKALLNKTENGYKGIKDIYSVEDFTSDDIEETEGTQVDDIAKKEDYPQFKLGKKITNLVEASNFDLDDALADVTEVAESMYKGSEIHSGIIESLLDRDERLVDKYTDSQKRQIVKWFENQEEMLYHEADEVINNLEPEEKEQLNSITNDRIIKGYKCKACNKEINNITDFKRKVFKDRNEYYCPYCGEPYDFEDLKDIEIKESYNYIGTDVNEEPRDENSHKEKIFTVYDQFGEIGEYHTREEAQKVVDEWYNDPELYGEEGAQLRIEEDIVDVLNNKVVFPDDLAN